MMESDSKNHRMKVLKYSISSHSKITYCQFSNTILLLVSVLQQAAGDDNNLEPQYDSIEHKKGTKQYLMYDKKYWVEKN